jgi:large subunit ribosomal protein L29
MASGEDRLSAKELRERNAGELRSLLAAKQEELQKTSFKHSLGQLQNTHLIVGLRKDVSRLKTILNEQAAQAQE